MQIGFELVILGMSTVFVFLILLIFSTKLMSKAIISIENLANEKHKNAIEANASPTQPINSTNEEVVPEELLSVIITSAIHRHRS